MKCKKRGCGTILSKVANLGEYCFKHQKEITWEDDKKLAEEEEKNKWAKGVQVTNFIPISESLDSFIKDLEGIKIKIKKKILMSEERHAVFRYS